MPELISCLMPTFNRFPELEWMVSECVECFLKQTDPYRELIICNDTPGQTIVFDHPKVKVYNMPFRFPNLSDKIRFMTTIASGEILCRWDDDDIHLSHRLEYSRKKLGSNLEWRSGNYWFDEQASYGVLHHIENVANSHVMSLWRREVLSKFSWNSYPPGLSLGEDQAFNNELPKIGASYGHENIPRKDVFYIYRWYNDFNNLSALTHPTRYAELGERPISHGVYEITPRWIQNHQHRINHALQTLQTSLSR